MDPKTAIEIEAAAFRRLLEHLDAHKEVQNLTLMDTAGFCRNCLAKWYRAAAAERGVEISDESARAHGLASAGGSALHPQHFCLPSRHDAFASVHLPCA